MVLWEEGSCNVKDLGRKLYLDSGTLTPLLKSLESKGLVTRERSKQDERSVLISLTTEGWAMRDKVLIVPEKVASCVHLEPQEAQELYRLLYKVLGTMADN